VIGMDCLLGLSRKIRGLETESVAGLEIRGCRAMEKNTTVLKWSLLAGSIYFLCVAVAHLLGFKVAVLFIYFDAPSYAYQNRIISFMAFGWSAFMFTAFTDPAKYKDLVKSILVSGAIAIVALSIINLTTDFQAMLPGIKTPVFWIETVGLFVYWLWMAIFYRRSMFETVD
jgi:hypothetical protein